MERICNDEVREVTLRVFLESELYGCECFDYNTLQDKLDAVARLVAAAVTEASQDGLERKVGILITPSTDDEFDDGEDEWRS